MRIAALMTCYNRIEKTLVCLEALFKNVLPVGYSLDVFLVDDGSSDGTEQAIRKQYPFINIIKGDGNLYWNGGMRVAFAAAMQRDFDYYFWLNDDTMLRPDALLRLLECESTQGQGRPVIVVGSTVDAETGAPTYGGVIRTSKLLPIKFRHVVPSDAPLKCDSMTGNIVLIPLKVAEAVGNIDHVFEHAMGDTDYALRARQMGFEVWVGAGIYGTCGDNPITGTYRDASQPLARRWQQMMGRKGLPWRSWLVLTRRHAGPLWIAYFAWPYLKMLFGGYR